METLNVLTTHQRREYEATGILFPISVFSTEETARYRNAFEEVEERLGGQGQSTKFPQLHLFFPWAFELITHPRILDCVEDVLGPNLLVHQTSIFSKRPHGSAYVSWHQDGDYWQLEHPDLVTVWVALTESTVENGCLRVLPSSHRQALEHEYPGLEPGNMLPSGVRISSDVDTSAAVDVVLMAGQVSLHHPNLVHGSDANRTGGYRTGFAIRYLATHVKQGRPHYQNVLVRGEDTYHYYDLLEDPPAGPLDDCVARYDAFRAAWHKGRYVLD